MHVLLFLHIGVAQVVFIVEDKDPFVLHIQ